MKTSERINRFMVMPGKHDAVWKKYGVNSAPTVLFLSPDGKKVADGGRDSAGLIRQINEVADKYNREPKWAENEEAASSQAKKDDQPLLIVYRDDKPKSQAALLEFNGPAVAELYAKAVWLQKTIDVKSDEAKAIGVTSLPALHIVDPRVEDPKARILKKVSLPKAGAAVAKELTSVLKAWKKAETPSEASEEPSDPPAEEPKE